MPYVRRDEHDRIVGWSISEQPDHKEFLPDDHPEIVAFNNKFPRDFLKPPTKEEIEHHKNERERLTKEHELITRYSNAFSLRLSELEIALANLLMVILDHPSSRIGHAIYFSPTSFHARCEIVSNSVIQIVSENAEYIGPLQELWAQVDEKIDTCRKLRNSLAHGSQITRTVRGKLYALVSPPSFDVIRVDRVLAKKDGVPGLQVEDINRGCHLAAWCRLRVDEVNDLISAFHSDRKSLPQRFAALAAGLMVSHNPSTYGQTIPKPLPRPRSSPKRVRKKKQSAAQRRGQALSRATKKKS